MVINKINILLLSVFIGSFSYAMDNFNPFLSQARHCDKLVHSASLYNQDLKQLWGQLPDAKKQAYYNYLRIPTDSYAEQGIHLPLPNSSLVHPSMLFSSSAAGGILGGEISLLLSIANQDVSSARESLKAIVFSASAFYIFKAVELDAIDRQFEEMKSVIDALSVNND